MSDRILRAGILRSDAVNRLSWPSEVFYRRLMSVVDDYGRYEAKASLLRADLYPLKIDRVSAADVDKWKAECASAGLVSCYLVGGKEYICIRNFNQRLRIMKSRFPAPPDTEEIPGPDSHPPADVSRPPSSADGRPPETETETEVETESETLSAGADAPVPDAMEESFKRFMAWVDENTPRVNQMQKPFTLKQYIQLSNKKYRKDFIEGLLLEMENYKPLLTKSISASLTFSAWAKRRLDNPLPAGVGKPPHPKSSTADEYRAALEREKLLTTTA